MHKYVLLATAILIFEGSELFKRHLLVIWEHHYAVASSHFGEELSNKGIETIDISKMAPIPELVCSRNRRSTQVRSLRQQHRTWAISWER